MTALLTHRGSMDTRILSAQGRRIIDLHSQQMPTDVMRRVWPCLAPHVTFQTRDGRDSSPDPALSSHRRS